MAGTIHTRGWRRPPEPEAPPPPRRPRDERFRQSGAIPYRRRGGDGEPEVLLVTSRSRGNWIVPKGMLEPDMTPHDSAAKEAMEEAGVVGEVGEEPAGSFTYRKGGVEWTVDVYDMAVGHELGEWPERRQRRRRWVEVDEAAALVDNPQLADLIAGLPARLARGERRGGRISSPRAAAKDGNGKRRPGRDSR